jgi:glyoxylase-like metal-dependent hydrolase (beta-lactamase superfamily II)
MSLDNTSHPGRPGPDELVPSRYALRVGELTCWWPDVLRRAAKRFLNEYHSQMRPFEKEYEVGPGVVVCRTGGHTPGHSVVRLASGGDRLTFAGGVLRWVPAFWDY